MCLDADEVTAIATAGATIVSIVAVFIAKRSAKAAEASADVAAKVLHRSAVRELVAACNDVISEELRIQSLVRELVAERKSLSIRNGQFGSSRQLVDEQLWHKDLATAAEIAKEAKVLIAKQAQLFAATGHDIDLMQARIATDGLTLQTMREDMLRRLEGLIRENQR